VKEIIIREVFNMIQLIKQYQGYKVLADDDRSIELKQININDKVLNMYQIYEVNHDNKTIYLEAVKHNSYILIASNDALELPLEVVDNLNKAAQYMKVESTHLYRAWRNAERPSRLIYKDYILIKI